MYNHLNILGSYFPYIPLQAFLYQPTSKNLDIQNQSTQSLQTDDYIIKTKNNQIKRLIFQADTKYTKFQNTKLKEFDDYIKRKNIVLDSRWNNSWKLRWLQSTNYNNKQTVQDMKNYIVYLDKKKEIVLTQKVEKYLKAGFFYVAGRDSKFRPIIVLDIKKMIKYNMKNDQIYDCQVFFFEFIIRNMLIPGRVEMWVTVIDVGFEGVMSIVSPMKSSISFLQSTFRSRMYVGYIIRPSGSCSFLWSIAQKFLQQDTKRKIVFVDDQPMNALLEYCNPSQLEKKFGGNLVIQENNCWPPKIRSENFQSKTQRTILTIKQYQLKYQSGQLENTKVYEPFVNIIEEVQQVVEKVNTKVEGKHDPVEPSVQESENKIQILKINLIEVANQVVQNLQKLREEDVTFLEEFNLQSQNLSPSQGLDWLTGQTLYPK